MDMTVAVVIALVLAAPPVLWVAWWLVSDIVAAGSNVTVRRHRAA